MEGSVKMERLHISPFFLLQIPSFMRSGSIPHFTQSFLLEARLSQEMKEAIIPAAAVHLSLISSICNAHSLEGKIEKREHFVPHLLRK